jgi:hypothetical protein
MIFERLEYMNDKRKRLEVKLYDVDEHVLIYRAQKLI